MTSIDQITFEQEKELLEHFRTVLAVQTSDIISIWPNEFLEKYKWNIDLTERELKVLEIDVGYVLKEIHTHSPKMIFHGSVEDTRYDFPPGHAGQISETVRIRKKNEKYVITIKKKNTSRDIKEREEFEVPLSNPGAFEDLFIALGLVPVHVKRKIRYSYEIENITLDLDLYYTIPALLEIEGPDKETIKSWIKKLGLHKHKVVNRSARQTLLYYGKRSS